MDMKKWIKDTIDAPVKKAIPVLSFPSIQLLNVTVPDLINDSALQAKGMKLIADRVDSGASLSMMDLSVEAEAFGSNIRFSDDEVPTVVGEIIETPEQADALAVPEVGAGRTGLYVDAIKQAKQMITGRPVFGGTIGPYSLAGRLFDVSKIMLYCYDDPDMVHAALKKVTTFLIKYIEAYKAVGADGVVIAEPLAGLLSPDLNEEFSVPYVREIVNATQTDDFIIVYHNCGNGTIRLIDGILKIGASAYHFGNAIDMAEMMAHIPANIPAMGNVDPASEFRNGTPESIRKATLDLLKACSKYKNFIISSGCDVPPLSSWDNIDAFFAAVRDFYSGKA